MDFREFLEKLADDSDAMYGRAINDIAGAIIAMGRVHGKPLEEIGKDLNAKVEELLKKEQDTRDWIKEFLDDKNA